ncbi:hypothetical protein B7463_g11087, partial [Scytalidium lignicola]
MGSLVYLVRQEDVVYRGYRKDWYNDGLTLSLFSRVTNGIFEGFLFDALKSKLRLKWKQTYDTVYPFGDFRECFYETLWVFNLVDDILFFYKKDSSKRLPLFALRQRLITLEDFELCDLPNPPETDIQKAFPAPYWKPALNVPAVRTAFVHRLLQDLNFQWRSVLRNRYNQLTFRKLARAVLRIAVLDFNVVEYSSWIHRQGGALVGTTDLPEWEPINSKVIPVGNLRVIATQDPQECIALIRKELNVQQTATSHESCNLANRLLDQTYLIMSLRHIGLYRYTGTNLEWTEPEPFLNGRDPVSDRAVDLLLSAIPAIDPKTALHKLPIEIQDRILGYISSGPVEPAKIGCLLGLGSPFAWRDGRMLIESERVLRNRTDRSPVESQIWFGDYMSGISYKGNIRTIPGHKEPGSNLLSIGYPSKIPTS